jgi:hypothetical protein
MGLTIHYDLHADSCPPTRARQLVERLHQRALDLPFGEVGEIVECRGDECDFHRRAEGDPDRWLLVQSMRLTPGGELVQPGHIIAFSTWPAEGCEQANFGLGMYPATEPGWHWASFCKTQYASNPDHEGISNFLRAHLTVVRLLDCAQKLCILEAVKDESGFWEKRDTKDLVETVGRWNEMVAALVGQYMDLLGNESVAEITNYPDFEHLEAKGRDPNRPRPSE